MTIAVSFCLIGFTDSDVCRLKHANVDSDWQLFRVGDLNWILQAYLKLRQIGFKCDLSNRLRRDAINVAANSRLRGLRRPSRDYFVVGVRADYPPVRWAQLEVVQNKSQVSDRCFWIPHFPQPDLLRRDPSRGCCVEHVAHLGNSISFNSRYFHFSRGFSKIYDQVKSICDETGIQLSDRNASNWNDFSDIDVALGIREFGKYHFNTKPPTKLVNAWLAGVPFIGGADSAFSQLGDPGYDYLRVTDLDGLRTAIRKLRDSSEFYADLVSRGAEKARLYTSSRVTQYWANLFECFLFPRFYDHHAKLPQ